MNRGQFARDATELSGFGVQKVVPDLKFGTHAEQQARAKRHQDEWVAEQIRIEEEEERRKEALKANGGLVESLYVKAESLYLIPAHLNVLHQERMGESDKNMNWTTGLVEVEVNTEQRIKNMIAAEEMKKKVLDAEAKQKKPAPRVVTSGDSVSSMGGHRQRLSDPPRATRLTPADGGAKRTAVALQPTGIAGQNADLKKQLDRAFGSRFEPEFVTKSDRSAHPTDDEAVAKFRERMAARGRRRGI